MEFPTTLSWLLILVAILNPTAPVGLARTTGEPSVSQNTACGPPGAPKLGRVVFAHRPDEPTAWPCPFIPKPNATVSPSSGRSSLMSPFGSQTAPSKRVT